MHQDKASAPGFALPHRTGDARDFDFLVGDWRVVSRLLMVDPGGQETWVESSATNRMTRYLNGVLNVDEFRFPAKGTAAVALRIFDVETRQWAIYWIEGHKGQLLPPVFGGFEGDSGEFYGEDELDGQVAAFRFAWTKTGPDSARWEQAYSLDGERWKVNWRMDFTRVEAGDPAAGQGRRRRP